MLRVIIFDFDGVIADTEPIHLKSFKETLVQLGVELNDGEYYERYVAFDDPTFFETILRDRGIEFTKRYIGDLISKKSLLYNSYVDDEFSILPGVKTLMEECFNRYTLAIGSGAYRSEIEHILRKSSLIDYVELIVAADDVEVCKPDPEVYLKVLSEINSRLRDEKRIESGDCVVIEDTVSGIKAAKSAGMKCLAITNSHGAELLGEADLVVDTLEGLGLARIEALFSE